MSMISTQEKAQLVAIAQNVLEKAYAPYSQFRVGAAVLTELGNVYAGCNVENSAYGLTICAERNAIAAAVTAEGQTMKIRAIAIANAQQVACSPCGSCRQVIFEFGADALVIFQGSQGLVEAPIRQLLPEGFTF